MAFVAVSLYLLWFLLQWSARVVRAGGRAYNSTALSRRLPLRVLLALVFLCAGIWGLMPNRPRQAATAPGIEHRRIPQAQGINTPPLSTLVEAKVIRVIDGDTIEVQPISGNGPSGSLRIIGVDTPETKHPRKPVMCYGAAATQKTQQLIDGVGGRVFLEKDVSERDRYGRLLRYVWLPYPNGLLMLNEALVREGYARVATFPPDVKYVDRFLVAEREARKGNKGLWAACGDFGVPVVYTATPKAITSAHNLQ